ncbi:MAG: type II toxin-antitoxin system RelE/ParE family toxin [Dehalococcoidia bacterium]|nr:type II toxin-antitoxin system RelE/ParE family toxin [Dehalococcoidia bacterium]
MSFEVRITLTAANMIRKIGDKRIQRLIIDRAERLAEEPEKQGTALIAEFSEYRDVRAVAQRYRIIYRIDDENTIVIVAAVGIRRDGSRSDIYSLARRLLRQGLLD